MAKIRLWYTIAGHEVVVESHEQMHLDEMLALWMARKFGTAEWVRQHCPNGVLELGVGKGEFDEHRLDTSSASTECCATLMAQSLGVADDPALQQVLTFVLAADRKGVTHPFDLHNLVKAMNLQFPGDQSRVIAWANEAIEVKYLEQREFGPATEAVKRGELIEFPGPKAQPVRVLVVHTDNHLVMKAAFSNLGPKPDLVIQQNSSGQVQMYTRKKSGIRLGQIVRYLRIAELRERGTIARFIREVELREEQAGVKLLENLLHQQDFVNADDCWYYFIPGEMILNGSHTASDVRPTELRMAMILDCVRLGLAAAPPKPKAVRPRLKLVQRPAESQG